MTVPSIHVSNTHRSPRCGFAMEPKLRVENLIGKGKVRRGQEILGEVEYDLSVSQRVLEVAQEGTVSDIFLSKPTIRGDIYTGRTVLPIDVDLDLELEEGRKIRFVSRGSRPSFVGDFH